MVSEYFIGMAILLGYFVVAIIVAITIRLLVKIPNEVFRKSLHLILLGALLIQIYAFDTWWLSVLAALTFIVLVFPILALAEHIKGFGDVMVERKNGELKRSLTVAFGMFALVMTIFWGWLDDRLLALAAIYAWGFGDAAAAIIGKRFGKHYLEGKRIEGRKTVEGTVAMFVVSFLAVGIILTIHGELPWHGVLLTSLLTAAASAVVELFTENGYDTITCPLAATAVILPMLFLYRGFAA